MSEMWVHRLIMGSFIGLVIWLIKRNTEKLDSKATIRGIENLAKQVEILKKEKASADILKKLFSQVDDLRVDTPTKGEMIMLEGKMVSKAVCEKVQEGFARENKQIRETQSSHRAEDKEEHRAIVNSIEKSNTTHANAFADFQKCLVNIAGNKPC